MAAVWPALRERSTLIVLGLVSEAVYLFYLLPTFPLLRYYHHDFDMAQINGYSHRAFWLYVAAFTLLAIVLAAAWHEVRRLAGRATLIIIFTFSGIFALTQVFVYPATAIDIFCYVAESAVMTHYHQNPLLVAPAAFPGDPIMPLCDGWTGQPADYGPLGVLSDALPSLVVGENLLANLILLKLLFSAMALACAYLVYRLLQRSHPALALSGALLVAWNPLILFQVSANGHNDIVMTLFLMLGLVSMVEGELLLGPALLAAAAMVKFTPAVVVPLFLAYGLARHSGVCARAVYLAGAVLVMLAVAAVLYFPFWQGLSTFSSVQYLFHRYFYSFATVLGSLPGVTQDQGALVGRLLFAPLYLYALWLATRGPLQLVRGCFLALYFFVALASPIYDNWYGIWPVTVAAAAPFLADQVAAQLFAWASNVTQAPFTYMWMWNGLRPDAFPPINNWSYALTFIPPTLVLLGGFLWAEVPGFRQVVEKARGLRSPSEVSPQET